jgi:hypothetical protein
MHRRTIPSLAPVLLALLVACGDDDGDAHSHGDQDPAEHACEHAMESGTELEGSAERDDSAPRIELGDEPYTITLAQDAARYVRLEIEEDTAVILFANEEDVVTGLYHEDEEESLVSAGANDHCEDEIPEHFDLDLQEAGTYYLALGPSTLSEAWIMVTEAEGHAH